MNKAQYLSCVLSQVSPFWMSLPQCCLSITSDHFCFTQTCDCGWRYFLCIGGWDALLLPYWNFPPPPSSVRCLPSFDLSYFCCVPRGMNSPSINISIVISAGRLRVTFRKMSWNWLLTFISQSGWGLFLARRVFTHPLSEVILKLKGYSVSAQGLAQIFCELVTSPGRELCAGWAISSGHSIFLWLRWNGWQMGMSFRVYHCMELGAVVSWELCHTGDLLLVALQHKRLCREDLGDAGGRMQQGSNWLMWRSWSCCSCLSWSGFHVVCTAQGALTPLQQILYFIHNAITSLSLCPVAISFYA